MMIYTYTARTVAGTGHLLRDLGVFGPQDESLLRAWSPQYDSSYGQLKYAGTPQHDSSYGQISSYGQDPEDDIYIHHQSCGRNWLFVR